MNAVEKHDNTPTLLGELNRKTMETIEKIHLDRANGRITEAQYGYGLDVLWSTVAGLVDNDFNMIMEAMTTPKKDASFYEREFYRSDKGHIAKVTNYNDGRVRVQLSLYGENLHVSEKWYDYQGEIGGLRTAKSKFYEVCDVFVAKGFEQL